MNHKNTNNTSQDEKALSSTIVNPRCMNKLPAERPKMQDLVAQIVVAINKHRGLIVASNTAEAREST